MAKQKAVPEVPMKPVELTDEEIAQALGLATPPSEEGVGLPPVPVQEGLPEVPSVDEVPSLEPRKGIGDLIQSLGPTDKQGKPTFMGDLGHMIGNSLAMGSVGPAANDLFPVVSHIPIAGDVLKSLGLDRGIYGKPPQVQESEEVKPSEVAEQPKMLAHTFNEDGTLSGNPSEIKEGPVAKLTGSMDSAQLEKALEYWTALKNQYAQAGLWNPLMKEKAQYAQDMIEKTQGDIKRLLDINKDSIKASTRFGNFESDSSQAQDAETMAKSTTTLEQLEYDIAKAVKSGNLTGARQLVQTALDQLRVIEQVRPSGPQADAFDNAFQHLEGLIKETNGIQAFLPANLAGTLASISFLRKNTREEFERMANKAGATKPQRNIYLNRGNYVDEARVVVADPQDPSKPLVEDGKLVEPSVVGVDKNGIPIYGMDGKPVEVTTVSVQWDPEKWIRDFEKSVHARGAFDNRDIAALGLVNAVQNEQIGKTQAVGTGKQLKGNVEGLMELANEAKDAFLKSKDSPKKPSKKGFKLTEGGGKVFNDK